MRKLSPKCIKILKTANLYLCFITLGLCVAVPGPCLLDLRHMVNTTTQQIALVYTARSVGYLFGSLLGGIVLDFVKSKMAVLTIFNFVVASSMLAIPWSRNLATLAGFMILNGFALGTVDIGGNVVCLTLWGSDSGPFYQALHFTFGLGGLVAPLLAAPFLGSYNDDSLLLANDNTTFTNYTSNFSNYGIEYSNFSNLNSLDDSSRIIYPFTIIGIFGLLNTIMFLGICIISPTEQKKSESKNTKDQKNSFSFLFTVIFLNFLLLFVETGSEIGYAQMLTTYVVKGKLRLPASTGSYMTSAFWAAFTVSRLASVFLAIKVSNFKLILNDLIIVLLASVVLLFLSSYEWAMWLASVLLGIGIASFFPAAVGWLDTYIDVNNKIASIFTVGAAFGEMAIPFLVSYYIETIPDVLIYLVPASSVSSAVVVFILYLILRKKEKKSIKQETECYVVDSSTINT